jgi:hypothetical protein
MKLSRHCGIEISQAVAPFSQTKVSFYTIIAEPEKNIQSSHSSLNLSICCFVNSRELECEWNELYFMSFVCSSCPQSINFWGIRYISSFSEEERQRVEEKARGIEKKQQHSGQYLITSDTLWERTFLTENFLPFWNQPATWIFKRPFSFFFILSTHKFWEIVV